MSDDDMPDDLVFAPAPFDDARASAYLDDELDATERREVAALIDADREWARGLDELARTRTLVRGLAVVEPPAGFLESLVTKDAAPTAATVTDLDTVRHRRRRRATGAFAGIAAAAALLVAVVVPGVAQTRPALATDVRVHQAGVAASSDPVSGLAPLGTSMRFGR